MQRWCLDSNIWIGLAQAPGGRAASELERRVTSGEIDITLPLTVYLEAVATERDDWRRDVVASIRRFWRGTTLLPFAAAWKEELRAALAGTQAEVFGRGLEHITGVDIASLADVPATAADDVRRAFNDPDTLLNLANNKASQDFFMPYRSLESDWVVRMNAKKASREAEGIAGEHAVRRAVAGAFFDDHYTKALATALPKIAVTRPIESLEQMLTLPTLSVYVEMETRRSIDDGKPSPNDVRDIMFMAVAVPHCDVVVTEKRWGGFVANRAKLDARFGTVVTFGAEALQRTLFPGS